MSIAETLIRLAVAWLLGYYTGKLMLRMWRK